MFLLWPGASNAGLIDKNGLGAGEDPGDKAIFFFAIVFIAIAQNQSQPCEVASRRAGERGSGRPMTRKGRGVKLEIHLKARRLSIKQIEHESSCARSRKKKRMAPPFAALRPQGHVDFCGCTFPTHCISRNVDQQQLSGGARGIGYARACGENVGQLALAAAKMATLKKGRPIKSETVSNLSSDTQEHVAEIGKPISSR